jgi:nucleotide-binding universal stress UspA family protein
MYERILVALDGSDVAEQVLPHVEVLAEKFGSAVTLVQATTSPEMLAAASAQGAAPAGPVVDPTPIVESERQEASEYLDAIAQRLRGRDLAVDAKQSEGPPGEVIVELAGRLGTDLIAMTTHGRGGLQRLVLGSVADQVLRHAPCPILLVRVSGERPSEA